MADKASRRGATNLGTPLMILAFAVIGGFLYWLNGEAAREMAEQQAYADSVAAAEEREANRPPVINPERIQMDASPFENDSITVESLPVASLLGEQGYWLEMPNGNPFLISVPSGAQVAGAGPLEEGANVSVTGDVLAINDSILTDWVDAGHIGEGDRLAAEFATHFIEATAVMVLPEESGEDEDTAGAAPSGAGGPEGDED
ncbi:MAG: hypothetical protein U5R14_10820 [Gemmatimonadota bacterium]|nr:hypothetical protein [Gemmatimonadota bacterium]